MRVCKCGDGTSSCVVAMTTSSALFIGHSISVDASRDRPKAIDRADMYLSIVRALAKPKYQMSLIIFPTASEVRCYRMLPSTQELRPSPTAL